MDFNIILNTLTMIGEEYIGDNICSNSNALKALRFIGYMVTIARFFVPLLVIGFGTLDLYKSVINGSSDSLSKQAKSLGMRVVIGILIFFVPTFLSVILSQIDSFGNIEGEYHKCEVCILEPFSCDVNNLNADDTEE